MYYSVGDYGFWDKLNFTLCKGICKEKFDDTVLSFDVANDNKGG